MPQQAAGRFEPGAPSQVCMMDGGSCGGRAKRQRSNSGAGKGVKAVLAAGSKGGVSYFGPPPGGIRAGRPRPTRQVGRCTPPPLSGAPWQRVLCGPKGPDSCLERPLWREWILSRAWRRVSSPGAALLVGTPSAVPQFGRGLDVGRKARACCGDSLSDIPAAWVPIPPGSGAG